MFQRIFKGVYRKFQGFFKDNNINVLKMKTTTERLRIFQGSFMGAHRTSQGCFQEFRVCFKEISRVFQGNFREISKQT